MSLNLRTKAEVMEAMRKIEEITGWSWWISTDYRGEPKGKVPVQKVDLRIPMDSLDEFYLWIEKPEEIKELFRSIPEEELKVHYGETGPDFEKMVPHEGIDLAKLIGHWKNDIPEEMIDHLWDQSEPPYDFSSPELKNLPKEAPVVITDRRQHQFGISLMYLDRDKTQADGTRGRIILNIDGYAIHLMPAFHEIREHYDAHWGGHDSLHYDEWWNYHSQYVGKPFTGMTLDNPGIYVTGPRFPGHQLYEHPPIHELKETYEEYENRK